MGIPNITYALFHLPKGTYLWLNIHASFYLTLFLYFSIIFSPLHLIRYVSGSFHLIYAVFCAGQFSIKTVPFCARCWVRSVDRFCMCYVLIYASVKRLHSQLIAMWSVAPQWDFPQITLCFFPQLDVSSWRKLVSKSFYLYRSICIQTFLLTNRPWPMRLPESFFFIQFYLCIYY